LAKRTLGEGGRGDGWILAHQNAVEIPISHRLPSLRASHVQRKLLVTLPPPGPKGEGLPLSLASSCYRGWWLPGTGVIWQSHQRPRTRFNESRIFSGRGESLSTIWIHPAPLLCLALCPPASLESGHLDKSSAACGWSVDRVGRSL
jgi:hypothetical protein